MKYIILYPKIVWTYLHFERECVLCRVENNRVILLQPLAWNNTRAEIGAKISYFSVLPTDGFVVITENEAQTFLEQHIVDFL